MASTSVGYGVVVMERGLHGHNACLRRGAQPFTERAEGALFLRCLRVVLTNWSPES